MATRQLRVEIDEEKLVEMEFLMHECEIRTKKDLINNALTLFKWAVGQRKRGQEIAAVDPKDKSFVEFDMPALSAIRISRWPQ